jgi:hypothetical protein
MHQSHRAVSSLLALADIFSSGGIQASYTRAMTMHTVTEYHIHDSTTNGAPMLLLLACEAVGRCGIFAMTSTGLAPLRAD